MIYVIMVCLLVVFVVGYVLDNKVLKKLREEAKKRAAEEHAKGHEVGKVRVSLHLKDGSVIDDLEFVGSHHDYGNDWSFTVSGETRFDEWMKRCGKLHMYSLGDGRYVNIDLVKEITVRRFKHNVKSRR